MTPKVSVILPTYNGASRGYLGVAIESVLNQSFKDFELLIIDDGSSDHTAKECKQYLGNGKVKYIFQENKGLAGARNSGIQSASGEYICFLDDDDIWKPTKLKKQIDFIDNRLGNLPNWGLIYTWLELIDHQGNFISYQSHSQEGWIYRTLLYENTIDAPSSVLIKRKVFDKIGFFDEHFQCCEDWDMWLRVAREYMVFPVKEYLVKYREHRDRMSFENEKIFHYEKAVIEKALATAPADVNPQAVYASCYMNRSISYFAADDFQRFRKMFLHGVKLSVKPLRAKHIVLFCLSLLGRRSVHSIRALKRSLAQRMIADH